ncbi:hypothetical protein MAPG_01244 [Magnaporthiopsis poae ATCC 64411]|uniref:TNT domain-containing protein n=1 Tax=Magnaporthiopsis poae (strain ATCC 64411 / 73-15) TaxID=644358 RepID=A0A0C4DN65_MAGP6|nr:hypothetical protein MAPG_01244 [Magnaporthiopsis poae ATCC 64411]
MVHAASLILLHLLCVANALGSPIDRRAPVTSPSNPRCALDPKSAAYCAGTARDVSASAAALYLCGDRRLGPLELPTPIPVDSILATYDRLGGMCPGKFLETFYDDKTGRWRYPDQRGYSVDDGGRPIKGSMTIPPGTLVDRFGAETGRFVTPAGTPYTQRALPPDNLLTLAGNQKFPYQYRVYRVVKPIVAEIGPIAPAFGQPGQGVQCQLQKRVSEMVADGSMEPVNPAILAPVDLRDRSGKAKSAAKRPRLGSN